MVIHLEEKGNVAVHTARPQKYSETGIPGTSKCPFLTPEREVEFYSIERLIGRTLVWGHQAHLRARISHQIQRILTKYEVRI